MIRRFGAIALLLLSLAMFAQPAAAKSTTVNVRIEGVHKTLFEGNVKTTIHKLNGHDGTGKHKCDGTNGGFNKTAGPTVLGAFDDARRSAGLTWHAKWFPSIDDFLIDRVGPDSSTSTQFWNQELNWKDLDQGGCHIEVKKGDHVLIAYNAFGKPLLKLSGPKHVQPGKAFKVKVVNGRDGTPVQGAKVFGHKTNANGKATIVVSQPRVLHLKAKKSGTIRSNALKVAVQP